MSEEQSYEELYNKGFDDKDTTTEQLEQPETEEDSNIETEPEEVLEAEEQTPEQEEQSETEEEETKEDYYDLVYKGENIKASKEELIELAQKGFDYTSKTQQLAKKRQIIDLLGDLNEDEVKALVDARNGDKEALSYIAKQAGVDIYDLESEVSYKPTVEKKNYGLDDAIETIKADKDNSPIIERWIDSLPAYTHSEFAKDPKILTDLHIETRNGVAQKVIPEVLKMLAMGQSSSFKEAYLSVRQNVVSNNANESNSRPEAKRETVKKATISKKNVSSKKNESDDVWEDDELYAKMQMMRRRY